VMVLPVSAASTAATLPVQHTVKPGEWIYCIARAYKVSPWSIASANAIPWPYWVYPGQVLTIPADPWYNIPPAPVGPPCVAQFDPGPGWPPPPTPTPTPGPVTPPPPPVCRLWHPVMWGQTLSGIAWYYGTTIQAIQSVNPIITNPNLIYAGTTLCIP